MNARATRGPQRGAGRRPAGPTRSSGRSNGGGGKVGGCVVVAVLTVAGLAGLLAGVGYAFVWVTA